MTDERTGREGLWRAERLSAEQRGHRSVLSVLLTSSARTRSGQQRPDGVRHAVGGQAGSLVQDVGRAHRRVLVVEAEGRELGDITTLRDPGVMAQLADTIKQRQPEEN